MPIIKNDADPWKDWAPTSQKDPKNAKLSINPSPEIELPPHLSGYLPSESDTAGQGFSPPSHAMASGASFRAPKKTEAFAHVRRLGQQCLSDDQIRQQTQVMYGWSPNKSELQYAKQGFKGFQGPPNQYYQYLDNPPGKTLAKVYRSSDPETQKMLRELQKKDQESTVKVHMILLQIMMGDIGGAVRSFALLMDRDTQQVTRLLIDKLGKVQAARSMVNRNFAAAKPPRLYTGPDKQLQDRSKEQKARFTRFFELSIQQMGELQSTQRELTDSLKTQWRDAQTMWEKVTRIEEDQVRADTRVTSMR